jgi:hypothetical protein
MRSLRWLVLCCLLLVVLPAVTGPAAAPGARPAAPAPVDPPLSLEALPLAFEPNQGQAASAVRYLARTPAGRLFFTASGVTLALAGACHGSSSLSPGVSSHS